MVAEHGSAAPPVSGFDGLGMHLGNLPRLSRAQSRSISPESFSDGKGKAGMASAFNCYWEMPFRKRCRITLGNIGDTPMTVYYQITYVETDARSASSTTCE